MDRPTSKLVQAVQSALKAWEEKRQQDKEKDEPKTPAK